MRITFHGAAREVTGSCFLVEAGEARFLVDCGLFQGARDADQRNRAYPSFDPASLDFAVVTHAHLDHCGLLPRLAARVPRLPVHATAVTADLLPIMLRDSAHIQEREARYHAPGSAEATPLYGVADVARALRQVVPVTYRTEFRPHPAVRARFRDAGHIPGSAIVELWVREAGRERKIVFSGDLGQPSRPLVKDPETVDAAEVLVVESTYGNRAHKTMEETLAELRTAAWETLAERRGNLVVPAFALGRTQDLLVILFDLGLRGELPPLHVFVDSPLARQATEVTLAHLGDFDPLYGRFARALAKGELPFPVHFTESAEDSMAINAIRSGAVIVAASGMCEGGRVRHHLRHNLDREECGVLFTGFQAGGTLGRALVDGATSARLFRETVPVRARIYTLGGLSAHADRGALLAWLRAFRHPPRRAFVVHGEEATALDFARAVQEDRGWNVAVPSPGESVEV